MRAVIHPRRLSGTVKALPSKSYAHRYLICASLADGISEISCDRFSDDILATIRCISALGARINCLIGRFEVIPRENGCYVKGAELDCGESGSTLRFLAPVVSAVGGGSFIMGGRLAARPMDALNRALSDHGVTVRKEGNVLAYLGKMTGGEFLIPGDISSQFVSGLLMALPLVGGGEVRLTSPLSSAPYVDITVDAMRTFGVEVRREGEAFTVSPGSKYAGVKTAVPGDWSNAAFWLASGVRVTGLDMRDAQGDKAITGLISRFGGTVVSDSDGVIACDLEDLNGTEIDADDIPDAVPMISVLAGTARGTTRIYNAARLRAKESDRIESVSNMLTAFGVPHEVTRDGLIIHGRNGRLSGGCVIDSANDHRIAMAAAVGAGYADGDVTVTGAEAVAKSYPGFWDDYKELGGEIDV